MQRRLDRRRRSSSRTRGNSALAAFYGCSCWRVAVHAPIGLAHDAARVAAAGADAAPTSPAGFVGVALLVLGWRAGRRGDADEMPSPSLAQSRPSGVLGVRRASRLGIALACSCRCISAALGTALSGAAALDGFLALDRRSRWSRRRRSALVFLLAAHLPAALRLLLIEFVGWRGEAQKRCSPSRRCGAFARWRARSICWRIARESDSLETSHDFMRIESGTVEDVAQGAYIRALKMLPDDIKQGFDAAGARARPARPRRRCWTR